MTFKRDPAVCLVCSNHCTLGLGSVKTHYQPQGCFLTRRIEPNHNLDSPESRAFVLRVRPGHGGQGESYIITLDDIDNKRKSNFTTLESAFAEIRKALNLPIPKTGKPH